MIFSHVVLWYFGNKSTLWKMNVNQARVRVREYHVCIESVGHTEATVGAIDATWAAADEAEELDALVHTNIHALLGCNCMPLNVTQCNSMSHKRVLQIPKSIDSMHSTIPIESSEAFESERTLNCASFGRIPS